MTSLSNLIPWLSDALLQCTALLILVLLAHRILKHSSASKQHALLLSGALGIPFLFIFSAVLPTYHIRPSETSPHLHEQREPTFISTTELGSPILNTSDSLAGSPSIIDGPNQLTQALPESSPLPLTFWLAVIWILGILLCWLRLGIGVIALFRIKTSLPDTRSHKILAEESSSLGLQKAPLLILLDDNTMPMTWWLGKHTLALPGSSADWSLEKLRHVIRHELAHIQRHDCQSAWITRAALALLWFHPLIWILNRSLNTTREVACDDLALANSSDLKNHENYARHLLDIVTSHSRTPHKSDLTLAMTRNNTDLQRRLTAILDQQQDRRPVSTRSRYLALPLWLVGLTALASLSACRTVEPASAPPVTTHKPTSNSQVEVSTTVIELEDPAILRKFFKIEKDEIQFADVITVERMEEILKKLPSSKTQTTKLPKVVTTIGRKGKSERTREFIYPTEYSPPQFPENNNGVVGDASSFPVTPASPTSFETRILGLSCEFTPNLTSGQNINLGIAIDHSHFLGFVNYGSPIMAPATNAFGFSTPIVVTENRIEMPLFRSHRFNTSYTIPPGHVVALIGLSLENSPKLDKVTRIFNTPQQTKLTAAKSTLYLIHPEILETP